MNFDMNIQQYVEWKVYNVTPIKKGYGYRVVLRYMNGETISQQKSGFSTKRAASADRDRTMGELYSGNYVVYTNVKVRDFLDFWLEKEMRPRIADSTYKSYHDAIRLYVVPEIGNINMSDLKRSHVQNLYYDTATKSVTIAKRVKTIMNTSMRYAVSRKIISGNPAKEVSLPKKIKQNPYHQRSIDVKKTLNIEQVVTLIEAAKESPIYMEVLFAAMMGLRRSEINGLKYSDIDYINRTLTVRRQLGNAPNKEKEDVPINTYGKQEIILKTQSSYRILPIPDFVFEAILERRKIYEKNRRRRSKTFQDLDFICCSSYGRPRSKMYYWPHYKKLLRENNLPDITFHDLRSTYCTLLLKNDFNPKAVSKLLGHAKEIITIDVYGDTAEIIEDCLSELQPFIDDVLPEEELEDKADFSGDDYLECFGKLLA